MSISLDIWHSVVYGDDLGPVEGRIVDAFFAPMEYTEWMRITLGYTHETPDAEEAHLHMATFRLLVAHALGGLIRPPPMAFEPFAVAPIPIATAVPPAPAPRPAPGWTWPWNQSEAGAAGVKST